MNLLSEKSREVWEMTRDIDNPLIPWTEKYDGDLRNSNAENSYERPALQRVEQTYRNAKRIAYVGSFTLIIVLLVDWPGISIPFGLFSLTEFTHWVSKQILLNVSAYLPPAYVVRGKVIFILGNVCLFTFGGVPHPYPSLSGGYPIQPWTGGYPNPALDGGVPAFQPWMGGYPNLGWGGTLIQPWTGGTPIQPWMGGVPQPWMGGTPIQPWTEVPRSSLGWGGYPNPGLGGTPSLGGYPIPCLGGVPRVPPPE